MYFNPCIRNDDGGEDKNTEKLSTFRHPCHPIGKGYNRLLTEEELHIAETYVIVNCKEVGPYLQ